jgi:hypothetical protein
MQTLKITACVVVLIAVAGIGLLMTGCKHRTITPPDNAHIADYHRLTSDIANEHQLERDDLALFVDYSNCIANGMTSPFYQAMVSPLTAATREYWSIKGDNISKEEGSVYALLNNVKEVNYAALDRAIEMMADRDGESVLLTDGELFTQTATKNNPNNPYMHAAFKKWLMKGHDIFVYAEPYTEQYHGKTFNKKRFYIIFSDKRYPGNILKRIEEVASPQQFANVETYHLSGNYPWRVPVNGPASQLNDAMGSTPEEHGNDSFEVQDWPLNWKAIQQVIMTGYDDEGNPLPHGNKLIGNLNIDRHAFGCYRIKDIDVDVYNINADYNTLYDSLEAGEKVRPFRPLNEVEIDDFITYDKEAFKRSGSVDLYFDVEEFAPSTDTELNGKPFNYFKIVISIDDLENILADNIEMFNFDSIVQDGAVNSSIAESLKNCVFDPDLTKRLKGQALYTIYVKANQY